MTLRLAIIFVTAVSVLLFKTSINKMDKIVIWCEWISHLCFKNKKIRCTKGIYNKEIRQLIKERKQLKRQITNSFLKHKKLVKKIKKYDKLIDHKISEFNINFIKRSNNKGRQVPLINSLFES